ncbi:hypothetical protein NP233_g9274 [Leucocoprinus birnbaumii]|uniref:Uncharacterized protein n=1 Tax=Leucocoprinus birnbaumii TaxID=56174 RepID=A0AAD5VN63_9AGAR|nr:hypothetical protein NP233_g9274 [Leucocoprinus birnbaumii]
MFIPKIYDDLNTVTTWDGVHRLGERLAEFLEVLRQLYSGFWESLTAALTFLLYWVQVAFTQPSEWTIRLFYAIVELVHTHIYWAHILAWSVFFGPIVVLVPFLVVHEVLILFAYNLIYTLHGLIPHSLTDQYESLRFSLLETRESLFSFVDRSSSVFNKWTAEHMPLMVLRLAAGALGSVLLYAIWQWLRAYMNLEETYSSTVDPFLPAFIMSERSPIGPSIFPPPGSRIETYGYVVALTIIVYDMILLSRKESTFTRMINTGSAVPGSFLIIISKAWSRFKLMYICTRVFALMEFSFCLYLIQQSVPGQTHPLSGKYIYCCDTAISEAAGIVPWRLEKCSFCILIDVPSKLITIHQVSAFLIPVISIEVVVSCYMFLLNGIANQITELSSPGNSMPSLSMSKAHAILTRATAVEVSLTLYKLYRTLGDGEGSILLRLKYMRKWTPVLFVFYRDGTLFSIPIFSALEYHGLAKRSERRKYGNIIHVAFTCILHLRITNHLEPTDSRP